MKSFDVVIVGAGPAGMAAAVAARKSAASVAVIDDNHSPGGQIWRNAGPFPEFSSCGAEFFPATRLIDADSGRRLLTVDGSEVYQIAYSKLVLATGARELFLPFPGWTLPGVFGVGGLQALAKSGLPVEGKRIIVAGTTPLLLAVAAFLEQHGARVPLIAEQASWSSLAGFTRRLLVHPSKIRQAVQLKRSLLSTSFLPNTWVTRAAGTESLEQVTLLHKGREIHERCDYLAVAYGFAPNTELAQLLGCELHDGFVAVDSHQQTSIPHIFCAGEPTGLGGADKSLLEGTIAGHAATGSFPRTNRSKVIHFTRALKQGFALRPELKSAVTPETIVCRCEDVPFSRLKQASNWREAKLHFRCGMGPCQGRVCGPAVEYLFGWKPSSVRPPVFATALQSLIEIKETTHL